MKDNSLRRRWKGDDWCCFSDNKETIQHLFFDCHYARFFWRAVHWVFGITSPTSVSHLFQEWSKLGRSKHNLLVLTGASALCWAIRLTRNDFVFNKSQKQTFLQVLLRGTCWLWFWTQLQCSDEYKTSILEVCRLLEPSAMFLFVYHGWSFSYRIGL